LDDREAVDVPSLLELLRSRQLGLLEDPVEAFLELALFRPEEVATPEDRDPEIVLDGIQVDVGGEGPVRDEDATHAPKVLLKFWGEDLFEFSEDDRLVHRPAHRTSVLVPHGAEVARVRSLAAFLAEHEGAKALFDRAVANVQRGVGPDRRDADLRRIVALEHLHNLLALDHRDPCLEPMRCPSIILCCGSQSHTMRSHRFRAGRPGNVFIAGPVSSGLWQRGGSSGGVGEGRRPGNWNGPRALSTPNYQRGSLGRPPAFRPGARLGGNRESGHAERWEDVQEEFSARTRTASLARMQRDLFDILVIGGGIVGAGIARDAARRGFRTALVDRGDFASGTSGKTSRLIHGGLRYLQNYKVGLVRLAVRERDRLLETAPGLIHPLPFVIPAYRGRSPGPILLRFGLFLYDVLSKKTLPRRVWLRPDAASAREPRL